VGLALRQLRLHIDDDIKVMAVTHHGCTAAVVWGRR
jgi:hypothetical protein